MDAGSRLWQAAHAAAEAPCNAIIFSVSRWPVNRRLPAGLSIVLPVISFSIFAFTACDPVITIAGANFPSWLLCMMAGAILAAMVRPLLVLARLERQLGPLTIFYPSLIAMFAMIVWIIFFNRV